MKTTKTIFIVDDDEDDRMFMTEAIRQVIKDVDIIEISAGDDMYEQFVRGSMGEDAQLILMDMNMPRRSGLEILKLMKQNPHWRHIPIVMVSTTSNPGLINKAYDLGVNAFITKPVNPEDYEMMAHTVNLYFMNNYPAYKISGTGNGPGIKSMVVIEDNDDDWRLMDFSLKRSVPGLETIRLRDTSSALDFFQNQYETLAVSPEFILLDLYLPGREDGLGLLKEIRNHIFRNNFINIPVIVFSYSNHPEDVNASLQARANAYLVKPPDGGSWPSYFENLCYIWSNTIRLPKAY
jgi:CheY-like chemotaxis protein